MTLCKVDADHNFDKSSSIGFGQSCDWALQSMGKLFTVELQSCCKTSRGRTEIDFVQEKQKV